ncbi:sensor domain-containing protein [Kribbella endophytica]
MNRHFGLSIIAATTLTLVAASCSGESQSSGTTSPSPSTTATVTPSSVAPTATPTPTKPPAAAQRTAAQLTKALLALEDLPAGISIDPDSGDEGDDVKMSSKDPKCAKLVAYMNADVAPGSKASAYRAFSASEQGPFIDEGLDAMGSSAAVQALQNSFRQAIRSCRGMTLSIPGEGRSPITVREVSAPKVGSTPVGVRFSASSGPLEGLEVTMATTGVQDVVVSVTVMGGAPGDIDFLTKAAVDKATKALGATSGT